MIFVFIGELTNWPNKMFPETGPKSRLTRDLFQYSSPRAVAVLWQGNSNYYAC
jgi:hypothetical protein